MFSKILIANRGEVAVRVIRAAREMGIRTVAVYSEPDAESLHARLADEAVCIGSAHPSESYLNIPAVISAAEITDVDAIHPGYGFLAENAHFAEICESCDITFIGPSPASMRLLGDKMAARKIMEKIGIPVIPGSNTIIKTKEEAVRIAKRLKYPVIINQEAHDLISGLRFSKNPSETCLRSMKKALENLNLMVDKGGRRSRIDRRIFLYGVVLTDRRSGKDRRSGLDRRISPQLKFNKDLERRQAFKF